MTFRYPVAIVSTIAVTYTGVAPATAQSTETAPPTAPSAAITSAPAQPVDAFVKLIVQQGRPLRVALASRITVKAVGQRVTGTLVEPVFAYDRAVVPAGTTVLGHVARLEDASRMARIRAMAGGDFSPRRHVVLEFDTLVFDDGREVLMRTIAVNGTENLSLQVAGASEKDGVLARARQEVAQKTSGMVSAVKSPGKMERLRDAAISRLPYHPQFLGKGTVYTAELVAPLDFGAAAPIESAPAGTAPAPESILNARLVTGLDSAKTPRGTAVRAVITSPVFSAEHRLILPEGSALDGEVTFAKRAAHFHRNGQLRFLFESVRAPETESQGLAASLYSVAAGEGDHLALDEEGGASIANSKTRFIAPALAILALRATLDREVHRPDADDPPGATATQSGRFGSRGVGGFFGFGLLGVGISQISRPLGIAVGIVGAARTVYTNVFGMGQEVSFPTDTRIQVQLAPGPSPAK